MAPSVELIQKVYPPVSRVGDSVGGSIASLEKGTVCDVQFGESLDVEVQI